MSIPYVPQGTSKRFRVPRTLAADFTAFLNQDIPNTVMDFVLLHNWYDQFGDDYEEKTIRGEIYPDSTKSRYEDTDNNMNFRADVNSGIQKGDMIIQPDGTIFLLDWFVALQSNNAPSRAVRCNMFLDIKRYHEGEFDEDGYRSEMPGWKNIVTNLPCNAYHYDGRPEYSAVSGTPGVSPNALVIMTVQYNHQTKNIQIGDRFKWGPDTHEIIDINRVGLDITQSFGTLKIQSKKVAGGVDYEEDEVDYEEDEEDGF